MDITNKSMRPLTISLSGSMKLLCGLMIITYSPLEHPANSTAAIVVSI